MTTLAFDSAVTFRWHDEDGRMHVDRSNLTRVQVAPYYGREIPDSERLGLDPEKIYYGYRPAEELSDPETVRSVIGIPIQLNHHLDYPGAPAKDTRVGSTGDSAKFDGTYLSNSLHIQDADACARIRDGSMRQLSLAYHYEPEMRSGEWNGQTYDFIMRRIRGQHLALVEEGRAGSSCIVEDHALELGEKAMNEETPIKAGDAPEVEETEVRIADEIGRLADDLRDLHETTETGEIVDNETAVTEDTDKAAKIEAIVEAFKQRGATDEEAAALLQALNELATVEPQAADEEVDPTAATDEEAEAEKAEEVNPVVEAAKAAGVDADNPEVLKAFEAGMNFKGEAEDEEPEAEDEECAADQDEPACDEEPAEDEEPEAAADEEEQPATAQDAAIRKLEQKFDAIDECRKVLGRVRASAFDSAGAVYLAALKQMGAPMRGVTKMNAQAVYLGFISGQKSAAKGIAQDSKLDESATVDLATGINVRL